MNRQGVIVLWVLAVGVSTCRSPRGPGLANTSGPGALATVNPGDFPGELQANPGPGRALSSAEVEGVLRRMRPIEADPADRTDFALRPASLPPPRPGATVAATFPPPPSSAAAPAVSQGPLEVVRLAPEGEVPLAPQLSVTFNQPMVEITSHAELAARAMPVKLTPSPPGQWRWAGSKTLLFEPMTARGGGLGAGTVPQPTRFPAATSYTVTIPAGTKSAVGGTLAAAKQWGFSTPTLKVVRAEPTQGTRRRDTLLFVLFDQMIDPQAVLATISVDGRKGAALRLATAKGIADDVMAAEWVHQADEAVETREKSRPDDRRWLAFRTVEPLPADKSIVVRIGPGTPSAEGPRRSEAVQEFSFRTFGPLRPVRHHCGESWQSVAANGCLPSQAFEIEFSNPIDADKLDPALVKVSPEIPNLKVEAEGNSLRLHGRTRGRLSYTVTVDGGLQDIFQQSLGKPFKFVWKTVSARSDFVGPNSSFVVLDPTGPARLPIYTVNHKVVNLRLYAVTPGDWRAFMRFRDARQGGYDQENQPSAPPGKLVLDRAVPVAGVRDEMVETAIDLAPALRGGVGQVVAWISAAPWSGAALPAQPRDWKPRQEAVAWVQITQIGLDAFADGTDLTAWTTSLVDGKPLAGVELSLEPGGPRGKSAADGLTRFGLGGAGAEKVQNPNLLVARRAGDLAMLPREMYGGNQGWRESRQGKRTIWYVFDDRHMYRPGEEVRWKGWLRSLDPNKGGDVGGFGEVGARHVTWELKDQRNNSVAKGKLAINALGGFDGKVKLPATMNLGSAFLSLKAEGARVGDASHVHTISVQEFRRPEFEVKATSAPGPHFVGDTAVATVTAAYYAGGGLPNAPVSWHVQSETTNYAPPGHEDYTFGSWVPWWTRHRGGFDGGSSQSHSGVTDAAGVHKIDIALKGVTPPRPVSYRANASVEDVNRQQWSANTTVLAHPGERYVGMKSPRLFVDRGQPIHVDAIVATIDGALVADTPIALRAVRLEWVKKKGSHVQEEVDAQDCKLAAAAGPQRCTFQTREGGELKVRATVADGKRRQNESELTLWVSGGKQPPQREVRQETVTLIPDKKSYAAGETAEILVQAPFAPAEGVLSLRRSGLVETRRFSMSTASQVVKVPIEEGHVPNLVVQVDLVGAQVRVDDAGAPQPKLPRRPAFASGSLDLDVPPRARTLAVGLEPAQRKLEPGGSTSVDVTVKDASGKPVAGAEVALVVVDEAVLALSGYRVPDPLALFYARRGPGVSDWHLRQHVLLADPQRLALAAAGAGQERAKRAMRAPALAHAPSPGAANVKESYDAEFMEDSQLSGAKIGGAGAQPIAVRANFDALAVFAPALPTDGDGRAKVAFKLPDSLTRYRVMAVAVHGERSFGSAESSITARLPLMVRPSAPRFLNFGDKFELPVVLQNQTDAAYDAEVVVRASNAMMMGGGAGNAVGRRVRVPANDRVEVRFAAAAVMAGTARFQVGGVSGRWTDAAEVALPVWTPATTEVFASYGTVDQGAIAQPVKAPGAVYPQFGGLEISTSSTELQALTDAVLYLVTYRFECAEQLASRVLAVAALKDVLGAFQAKGLPSAEEMVAAVKRDLRRLEGLQNRNGGFGFWRRDEQAWPYLSVHVVHALQRAKEKGFAVPEQMLRQGHGYLRQLEKDHMPASYPTEVRDAIAAYALYVRARLGDRDVARANQLLDKGLDRLGMEAIAWLYPVLSGDKGGAAAVKQIRRHLGNKVSEEAGTAHFTTGYGDGGYLLLASSRRVDGILLEGLIADQPRSELIPKLVRGLLGHRTAGRWESTQESAWVLLGLDRYFQTFEKEVPNFTARTWLGDKLAGEHAFKGRSTERSHVNVPMAMLAVAAGARPQNLTLAKDEGPGRLYYRIGMQYAPRDLKLPPAERGFTVQREYEAMDKTSDVSLDPQGVWRVKAGARVRVRLTMVAPARRYHVALVDPLPAGFEAMNPALAVTGPQPEDPGASPRQPRGVRHWSWLSPWYQHQNLRDDRAEAFTPLLYEGVYTYSYIARATTPGNFVVPPVKAEEMYHPETFGRSGGDRVIVE